MNKPISMYKNVTHHQHHRYNEKYSCLHFRQLAFSRSVKSSTWSEVGLSELCLNTDTKQAFLAHTRIEYSFSLFLLCRFSWKPEANVYFISLWKKSNQNPFIIPIMFLDQAVINYL